jgi:5-methylcytosine-specific restriction endonuclease McrA
MATIAEVVAEIEQQRAGAEERRGRGAAAKKRFRSSLVWRRVRYAVLRENAMRHADGLPRCELCNRTAAESGGPLHVDHRVPIATEEGWRRRFDRTNLAVLCVDDNLGKLAGPDWRTAA